MKTLIFYPTRCVPPASQISQHSFDGVILKAGNNDLSEEEAEKLLNHPDFERYQTWGAIELIGETSEVIDPAANTEKVSLANYSVEDAEKIIEQTHDAELLAVWLVTETRKTLRQAINRRITTIKGGNE
jgi:hypothetical protein